MKKHSGTILLVLIFFVGLAVMLYPTISDYINQRNQTRVVNSYAQQVDGLSDADYTAYFDAADVFNQKIAAAPDALYHADAMDVDSDIRVMETMLRRDGGSVEEDFGLGGTAVATQEDL